MDWLKTVWQTLMSGLKAKTIIYETEEERLEVERLRCDKRAEEEQICHSVTRYALDNLGLNGMYWYLSWSDYDNNPSNVKILSDYGCEHFRAISGAVQIVPPVTSSRHCVKVGPAIPCVLKDELREGEQAVLNQIKIGSNIAYPVFYYSEKKAPFEAERWKSGESYACQFENDLGENRSLFFDFNIAPWIKTSALQWIHPDDETLTVHNNIEDCPYLNLRGTRKQQFIEDGKVRFKL